VTEREEEEEVEEEEEEREVEREIGSPPSLCLKLSYCTG